MKLKTLVLTVTVLALLSALAWYLQRPPRAAAPDPRVGQTVFDAKALDQATQLRLSDQGKTVVLTKGPDGKWIDTSYFDLPADFSKLGRFIDDLSGAKIQRVVSRNPEVLARLEFKDTAISLLNAAGKDLWKLTLGKDAEGGGRFVKFDDETTGYLANIAVFLDADAKNWADSQLINLKSDDVAAVDIGFADGQSVAVTRAKKDEPWAAAKVPAGQRLKAESITSLLSTLTTLRFQDTSDLTDPNAVAAREHSRTVKLTTFDGKTLTVALGRKPEEKKSVPQKSEVSGQPAAPPASPLAAAKPEGEAGKSEVNGQNAASETKTETAATANAEPKTQNPEPKTPNPAATPPAPPKEETIPAGPVYASITSSDAAAPIDALMKKRAFQISDWNFTSLPQKPDDLFEPIPAPPAEKKPEAKPEAQPASATPESKPVEAKLAEPAPEAKPATSTPETEPAEAKPPETPKP